MRSDALGTVVRRLRSAVAPAAAPVGPDAELVRAFATRRDPAAFEAVVRRHGPMVLGVCRRVLRDLADADDAFQATFLVLVRKAGSLRHPERLAGWLHQVAHRTARKVRAARQARARREGELFDVPARDAPADLVWRELRPIFDQELDRLPDKLRLPAVLCFLEGHSKGEAARTLGWPEGTLSGRLQQAREKLRVQFAARGLTLSAGALAVALFEGVGSAAVSDRLIASTLHGAATGPAGMAGAWALADGVTQAMFLAKVKSAAAAVLVAGVVGTGTGMVLVPGTGTGEVVAGETPKDQPKEAQPAAPKAALDLGARKALMEIDRARTEYALAEIQRRQAEQKAAAATESLKTLLTAQLNERRSEEARLRPLVAKGVLPRTEYDRVVAELQLAETELKKLTSAAPKDLDREGLQVNLRELKDRLAWEEQMVKKGFLTEGKLARTKLEVARAEAALAKYDAPKPADRRRAVLEELVKKLEQIVAITSEAVKKGVAPQEDVVKAEQALRTYKIKLGKPGDGLAADLTAKHRAALEATVGELEKIVAQQSDAVKRGIVPRAELLSSEVTLLRYKLELLELADPRHGKETTDRAAAGAELRKALITQKENELRRAERLLKENVVSHEEIRRLRIDLAMLKAEAAAAAGDHAAALSLREGLVSEWEFMARDTRKRLELNAAPRAELRTVDVALAEAKIEALKAGVRRQLADIVRLREHELADAKTLFDTTAIPAEEVRKAEQALTEAKLRLAEER